MRRRNLGARGRIGLCLATALVGASIGAPAASGIFLNFDYMGHVKGEPTEQVEFNIKKTATGHRKVVRFIVSHIPYSCSDAPSGVTGSQRLDQSMPVSGGQFAGSGDWVDVTSDPVGTVSGSSAPQAWRSATSGSRASSPAPAPTAAPASSTGGRRSSSPG